MPVTSTTDHRTRTPSFLGRALSAAVLIGGIGLAAAAPASAASHNDNPPDPNNNTNASGPSVTLCHATNSTTNPYRLITVDVSSVSNFVSGPNGHGSHTGPLWNPEMSSGSHWGDIIPPFSVNGEDFEGLNYPEGASILADDCEIEEKTPEPLIEVAAVAPTFTEPTCDDPGSITPAATEGVSYEIVDNEDGTSSVVASLESGYTWSNPELESTVTFGPYPIEQLTGEQCDTDTPVDDSTPIDSDPPVKEEEGESLTPAAPGPETPPVTQTPAPETEALPPQAPAPAPAPEAPAPAPAAAPAADPTQATLPSTGSTSGVLATVAGLLMLAGFGLRRFGPQRIDQLG